MDEPTDSRLRAIAVLTRNTARLAWAVYRCLYAGRPLLPLDPERSGAASLITDCGIDRLFCDPGLDTGLPDGIEVLPSEWLEQAGNEGLAPPKSPDPRAVQLYMATSGTRSTHPRAVMLSGANLTAAVEGSRARIPVYLQDRWLACLPLFHIGGLSILLRCLHAGACAVLHEGFDAQNVWAALSRHSITHISLVPAMLWRLLEHSRDASPPDHLRSALVGGGPLSPALARRALQAGWPLCATYGLSEAASQVATRCTLSRQWQQGDVGPPLPGNRVEIVDEQGRPTARVGRIKICGPTVMVGYANPSGRPGEGLCDGGFVTSDLGLVGREGHLHLLGRADEVLISGGETIHPAEVETRLTECPGVEDAAITSRADPVWGDVLVALVVGHTTPDQLLAWSRRHLASRLRPRDIVMTDALPRNGLGKLDRRALAELLRP
jgi:O-succinylbenzoic acid--CoA ligase